MDFKPSTFYIGVIDLFAIILPGAIASLVLYHFYETPVNDFLNIGAINTGFYSGFVLLLSSYLLGHIISQVSAYLDECVYEKLKDRVYKDHKCLEKVEKIREQKYGNVLKPEYVKTYQWSVFKLQEDQPHIASEVERYMADGKFFRGLFVLLIFLTGVFMFSSKQNVLMAIICLGLAAFSMARYFRKYQKSSEMAYQAIIFFEDLNSKTEISPVPGV